MPKPAGSVSGYFGARVEGTTAGAAVAAGVEVSAAIGVAAVVGETSAVAVGTSIVVDGMDEQAESRTINPAVKSKLLFITDSFHSSRPPSKNLIIFICIIRKTTRECKLICAKTELLDDLNHAKAIDRWKASEFLVFSQRHIRKNRIAKRCFSCFCGRCLNINVRISKE
jgi:hypothetical protein